MDPATASGWLDLLTKIGTGLLGGLYTCGVAYLAVKILLPQIVRTIIEVAGSLSTTCPECRRRLETRTREVAVKP